MLTRLGMLSGKKKSHEVCIPDQIVKKGWNFVKWTIRGIMDTDGTLFFSKKTYKFPVYPTIEIRTYSRKLALQITNILEKKGFRVKLRGSNKMGYHVSLYGMKMLKKWMKEIGFSNPKHIDKLLQSSKNLYENSL
jgi:hypothetical protein